MFVSGHHAANQKAVILLWFIVNELPPRDKTELSKS